MDINHALNADFFGGERFQTFDKAGDGAESMKYNVVFAQDMADVVTNPSDSDGNNALSFLQQNNRAYYSRWCH